MAIAFSLITFTQFILNKIMFSTKAIFCLAFGLTSSFVLIASSTKAISQEQPIVVLKTPNHLSVPVNIDSYLGLIDGNLTELKTAQFLIRRRLVPLTRIAPHRGSHTPSDRVDLLSPQRGSHQQLFTLYLDFYSLDGKHLLGSRVHNLPKTK